MDNNVVKRGIYYYDLFPVVRENSKIVNSADAIVKTFNELKNIYQKFLKAKKKNAKEEADRLLNDVHFLTNRGDYLYILVDEIKDYVIKFRIVRCRTNALPYIEIDGELQKITEKISGKFDVAEVTHCVIFANKDLMGAEYNSSGARATSIAVMIDERKFDLEKLKVLNKLDKDVIKKLQKGRKYKLFHLVVKNSPEIIDKLIDKNIITATFKDFDFDTYTISIKRRITKNKNGFIPPFSIEEIEDLLKNNGDQIVKFEIDQGLYSKEINLLSEKISVVRSFEYDIDERVLDKNKVYNSIIESAPNA